MKRFIAALAVLLGALAFGGIAGGSAPAAAHAYVVDTDPLDGSVLTASPDRLRVTFNESIRLPSDAVELYDSTGKPVPVRVDGRGSGFTASPERLAAGTYALTWRIVSADGHPVAGSLSFSVIRPSATVVDPPSGLGDGAGVEAGSPLAEVHHGIEYAVLLLAVGLLVFRVFLLPEHGVTAEITSRLDRLLLTAAATAGVLSVTLALLDTGSWLSSGLVVVGLAVAVVGTRKGAFAPTSTWTRVGLAATVLALASEAMVGHTRAAEPVVGVILVDVAHLAAGAVWFGGLVGLALTLPSLARRESLAVETLSRFSTWGAVTLGILVSAGLVLTWRIVQSWDNLWHSPFGHLLLVKVGLVAVIGGIAAVNRFVLLPRSRAAVGHEANLGVSRLVRRAVQAEAGLIVAVLLVTGFLVDRSPVVNQDVAAGGTGTQSALIGDYRVFATLAPSTVGSNRLRVQIQDLGGEPVERTTWPTVSVRSAGLDLGARSLVSDDVGTRETTVILPKPGRWEVQVSLRIDEFTNPVITLPFTVSP
jgi:copper transport protein